MSSYESKEYGHGPMCASPPPKVVTPGEELASALLDLGGLCNEARQVALHLKAMTVGDAVTSDEAAPRAPEPEARIVGWASDARESARDLREAIELIRSTIREMGLPPAD